MLDQRTKVQSETGTIYSCFAKESTDRITTDYSVAASIPETTRRLNWSNGSRERSGVEGVEDFFAGYPAAPGHGHAVLHIIHRLH